MNPDWLAQLAPEYAPAPPGLWPPAPGWWGLAALLIVALSLVVYRWRSPALRRRRFARRELRRLRASAAEPEKTAQAIENLLRRYALAVFGREPVAGLGGDAWLTFVTRAGGRSLGGDAGRSMLAAAFGAPLGAASAADREAWFAGADEFIRRARRGRVHQ